MQLITMISQDSVQTPLVRTEVLQVEDLFVRGERIFGGRRALSSGGTGTAEAEVSVLIAALTKELALIRSDLTTQARVIEAHTEHTEGLSAELRQLRAEVKEMRAGLNPA